MRKLNIAIALALASGSAAADPFTIVGAGAALLASPGIGLLTATQAFWIAATSSLVGGATGGRVSRKIGA